ncbi:hypothetical protein [Nocardioides sp.]|uniref:hypothetical protein n=1 Tax=Nocardioides sp. TaxID=35761 RepID=UPI00262B3197|nr:hypothetical protein [Nocardioides sp.]
MSRPHLLLAGVTAVALSAAALSSVPAPAYAVVGSQSVTFTDCDLDEASIPTGMTTDVTTTISLEHPSPVPTNSAQTLSMTLGTLPAGTFPEDLTNAYVAVQVTFDDGTGATFTAFEEKPLVTFDADAPLALGEFEEDFTYYYSGLREFRPKELYFYVYGDPGDGEGSRFYEYECDQRVNPASLMTVAIFDPAAPAQVTLNEFTGRQGGTVLVSGTDFAHETPDDPDGDVTVTVGGLPAGSFDVDETGAFSGVLQLPEFVKPGGQVTVRATSQGEVATTALSVSAKKGTVKVSSNKVKVGKKLTVQASSFKPGETLKIALSGGKGKGRTSYTKSVKANASGVAGKAIKLKKAATGKWKVKVTGSGSFRVGSTGFKVTK